MANEVIDLILQRARSGSLPGKRTDNARLGLAIEGGAMRAIVSAGMLLGLIQLGVERCFDVVFGASGGAVNGAYFVSGQGPYGGTIYTENINNKHFINVGRFFLGKHIVDTAYLFDNIMTRVKKLDVQSLIEAPIPLKIVASSISELKSKVLADFADGKDVLDALRASSRMPLVAGPPVQYRGDSYIDASVFEGIPIRSAMADGCTHVLTLLTRPEGSLPNSDSFIERQVVAPRLERYASGLGRAFLCRYEQYLESMELLQLGETQKVDGISLAKIAVPQGTAGVGRMETRKDVLIAGAKSGLAACMLRFGFDQVYATETLTAFDGNGCAAKL